MVRYILFILLLFVLLVLLVIWVVSGGPRQLAGKAKLFTEPNVDAAENAKGFGFRLPWQPAHIFPALDISQALAPHEDARSKQDELAELEVEYDRLRTEVNKVRTFGNASPYVGRAHIGQDSSGVRKDNPHEEYIMVTANYSNGAPVNITGWSLQSALSSVRVILPPSASPFISGTANAVVGVSLEPGALALITSGVSQVGISFRENTCTGYLSQFQSFSPPLSLECPSPSDTIPMTIENLERYGDACFDYLATIPTCTLPQNLPDAVSPACRARLQSSLSYNGCVQDNRFRASFNKNMWRLYLGSPNELWRNSHDAIRLLDEDGRTVDVFIY